MKILVTGAGGFVGQLLAEQLLNQGHHVVLTDIFEPPVPPRAATKSSNATCLKSDIYEDAGAVLSKDLDAIYIFHGIMSSGSEADLALGYRVNLHSTLRLLDAIRTTCPGVRVIYASSCAIYGPPLPALPNEDTLPTPEGSYGAQKVMVEYAINDYSRRGILGPTFIFRFPTISVRPGKPTAAASSWMSGIIREPLQGLESNCPCPDEFESWLCSPRTLAKNLIIALELKKEVLPAHKRQVNLPGITATVKEMLEALEKVGGKDAVKLVKRERADEQTMGLLESWGVRYDTKRALECGFVEDQSFEGAVRDFAEELRLQKEGR